MTETAKKKKNIVFTLSLKDLKHEWILTICLIMAISAVLSPLLLLFGLKYGIIDWGLNSLKTNPIYREIRPMTSKSFNQEWFDQMDQQADISFIIPMTRQISATVKAGIKGKEGNESLNIIPTRESDPLILENGAKVPGKGECVLTQFAAEALKASVGDVLVASASRIVKSQYEFGDMELKVTGILSLRASELKSLYVPLPVLEAVERYKDGQSVPEFGWPGSTPKAYPEYDGLIIVLPEKLDKVDELGLCNKTGFTKIESLDNAVLPEKAGFQVLPEKTVYRLYTMTKAAGEENIANVSNRLRGKNAHIFPWVSPLNAQLTDKDGKEIASLSLYGLSPDEQMAEETGLAPVPEWGKSQSSSREMLKIMLPPDVSVTEGEYIIKIAKENEILTFPVSVLPQKTPWDRVSLIPSELAGILKLYQSRNIQFDENLEEFVLFRQGYAGFRLYARSIFDVDNLRKFFDSKGIPVHTEIMEINKVIQLDKGFTLIFWLLAAVGIAGSVASLVASLYASVERKKREMSVLRLIGLSGGKLFRFPVYQGIMIAGGGFFVSMIIFGIFSKLINRLFSPYVHKLLDFPMEAGVSFCRLPFLHTSGAFICTITIAAVAAMVAAIRVTRIEPAEALRDE